MIIQSFTAAPNLCAFLSSVEHKRRDSEERGQTNGFWSPLTCTVFDGLTTVWLSTIFRVLCSTEEMHQFFTSLKLTALFERLI